MSATHSQGAANRRPEFAHSAGSGDWLIDVWVQPGASRNEPAGLFQGRLKLKLSAPAVENKANKALVKYVARLLGLKQRDVELVKGHTCRAKTLAIASNSEPAWDRLVPGDNG
ncbi:DUF167 domain-containing protein [Oceanidesulfovibrio indonesiensis]|uniref:UPF0235 protein DPQ33_13425 n=1 Tax=Oceanidesulfovibrio indonesiensis TaxID=54767 RepID=A0A7M3MCF0_9BACT|nr:DUF167 domain-containing protein [Oceanidesulfovibrio indonesiensis]